MTTMTTSVPNSRKLVSLALGIVIVNSAGHGQPLSTGASKNLIIDSQMSEKDAFDGLDSKCPDEIRKRQQLITVEYYSMDKQIHQGQLVIDRDLVGDIKTIFALAIKELFPIYSVIPISDKRFRKGERWDDELSMEANNTSAFNYRETTGGGQLSNHAYGRAIDINTFLNPYIKGDLILPHRAKYNPMVPGTLTSDNPIVREFLKLGWNWGGNFIRIINILRNH
jgi:peptidoglycan L-alanyl-D-glutamate endopeptidase CwlK